MSLASSVLAHTVKSPNERQLEINGDYDDALEALAGTSRAVYDTLLKSPGFIDYFREVSPVEELALLKIGSRPARRFGAAGVDDLRAIPWVFAWTQNRHMITGWYGMGSALQSFVDMRGPEGLKLLREMFASSRLFRLMIDEAEKTLYVTDMEIAREYRGLAESAPDAANIFNRIRDEYHRTQAHLALIVENDAPDTRFPAYRDRVESVRANVDRANLMQVQLLHEFRQDGRDEDEQRAITVPLLMTMNCIAAGLGWTG